MTLIKSCGVLFLFTTFIRDGKWRCWRRIRFLPPTLRLPSYWMDLWKNWIKTTRRDYRNVKSNVRVWSFSLSYKMTNQARRMQRQDVLCSRPIDAAIAINPLCTARIGEIMILHSYVVQASKELWNEELGGVGRHYNPRGIHTCRITSSNKRWNPLAGVEICTHMSDDNRPNVITCHHHQFPLALRSRSPLRVFSLVRTCRAIRD